MALSRKYWTDVCTRPQGALQQFDSSISFDKCVSNAYQYITAHAAIAKADVSDIKGYRALSLKFISQFVDENQPSVIGFNQNGILELPRLIKALEDEILNWGPITPLIENEKITEIQINDYKSIYIEEDGRSLLARNPITGKPITFQSPKDCMAVISKLLRSSDVSLSKNIALQGAMTPEGYRVAACDPDCAAPDKGENAHAERSPIAVIRKFPKNKHNFNSLIGFGSMSAEMAEWLRAISRAGITILVAGATGSGKTVLAQCILDMRNPTRRTASVEDQSELSLHQRDSEGIDHSNTFQFEARPAPPGEKPLLTYPSFENIIMQLLRMTPRNIVIGELRTDTIINLALTAANTGHVLYTTVHAKSVADAIVRLARAIQAEMPSLPWDIILQTICDAIPVIVSQQKLDDGTRKLLEISEIMGVKQENGRFVPDINPLFRFKPDGLGLHEDGKIHGEYIQINRISQRFRDELSLKALTKAELDRLFSGPAAGEPPIVGQLHSIEL